LTAGLLLDKEHIRALCKNRDKELGGEMTIVLGWLILAVLVGVYADSKGHSGLGMFFVAIVLSPLIGFLIEAVRTEDSKVTESRALSSGNMKKCPACAELIKREARKCRYCGEEFWDASIPSNEDARKLLTLAKEQGQAGIPERARELLQQIITEFPDSKEAAIARNVLGV
jgi:hypothetical protein